MKSLFGISTLTLTLAACGVSPDGGDDVLVGTSERVIDSTIASQTFRSDDAYDVVCADGGQEIDSAEQIAAGLACVASRSAAAHFFHMFESMSGVGWSATGVVTNGVEVQLKVIGANVSAVFFDRSGNYPPLTADLATLAADGSFTATATVITTDAGCPSYFGRTKATFTVAGAIDGAGAVALDICRFFHEVSSSKRTPFTCAPDGEWLSLARTSYSELAPADPTTLSD